MYKLSPNVLRDIQAFELMTRKAASRYCPDCYLCSAVAGTGFIVLVAAVPRRPLGQQPVSRQIQDRIWSQEY